MSTAGAPVIQAAKERIKMPRTRLHIENPLAENSELDLEGNSARYVGRALRLSLHDEITLFDGRGGEYQATIITLDRNRVRVAIGKHVNRDVESPLAIHLLQGISRGERMDFVMQKATELGVHKITPLVTDRTMVKLAAKRAEKRLQHWRGIVASACEQSGRNVLPAVCTPQPFRAWLGENINTPGTRLIMKPDDAGSFKSVGDDIQEIVLLIGPEGGFSDDEYELAQATGFQPIGFGRRILRTETAAVAALAALQTLYGDVAPG